MASRPSRWQPFLAVVLVLQSLLPAVPAAAAQPGASDRAADRQQPAGETAPSPASATPGLALHLAISPPWAAPGETVTFTLVARNARPAVLTGLSVSGVLPDLLAFVPGSASGGLAYAPGATVAATLAASGPVTLAASARLEVAPPRAGAAWITPTEGGLLRAPDDRALLRIPPGRASPGASGVTSHRCSDRVASARAREPQGELVGTARSLRLRACEGGGRPTPRGETPQPACGWRCGQPQPRVAP
jgi:uncharacterized repeat protein (TIGR01451 family)